VEFCPSCFAALPPSIDEEFLNNYVAKQKAHATFVFNFIFFGFTQYLTRFRPFLTFSISVSLYFLLLFYFLFLPVVIKVTGGVSLIIFTQLYNKILILFFLLYLLQFLLSYFSLKKNDAKFAPLHK